VPATDADTPSTVLGCWYATVLTWRSPVVLLVNETSLLPVLLPLAPARTLLARVPAATGKVLAALGVPEQIAATELAAMDEVRIAPTASRSLVGVMTELGKLADWRRGPGAPDLLELSLSLAETPLGPLRGRNVSPDRELAVLLGLAQPARRERRGRGHQPASAQPGASAPTPTPTARDRVGRSGDSSGRGSAFGNLRVEGPEMVPGPLRVSRKPGMADAMLAELAPLLAEDGIDLNNPPDLDVFQAALARAVERRNMALFTPIGARREVAAAALTGVVLAIATDRNQDAAARLERIVPESATGREAEVSAVMGLGLGLLDTWLAEPTSPTPGRLATAVQLPAGPWFGRRAATEILALAHRGRASSSLGALITGQGSHQTLAGTALATTAVLTTWANLTGQPLARLAAQQIH
jgi:hypothetical protein